MAVDEQKINDWREAYEDKRSNCEMAEDGDGYKFWAAQKDWTPQDDEQDDEQEEDPDSRWISPKKSWYRWDWKKEVLELCTLNPLSLSRILIQ